MGRSVGALPLGFRHIPGFERTGPLSAIGYHEYSQKQDGAAALRRADAGQATQAYRAGRTTGRRGHGSVLQDCTLQRDGAGKRSRDQRARDVTVPGRRQDWPSRW